MMHMPSLWFGDDEAATVRRRIAEGEPTAAAVYAKAKAVADRPLTDFTDTADEVGGRSGDTVVGQYAEACAIAYLVTGEADYAVRAHDYLVWWTQGWTTGELKLGTWALYAALVHECCYRAWSAEQRRRMTRLLARLFEGQKEVEFHRGNPHDVTNNHWAVSHAAAAIAAMAAHGHPLKEGGAGCDLTEGIAWARGRAAAFLMHLGDAGLYHEGLGYLAYPATFLLPLVIASRRFDGYDLLKRFPNLRNLGASLYGFTAVRPTVEDDGTPTGAMGMTLSWNDAGLGWSQSSVSILLVHLAHARQVGALRTLYDRLNGIHGDGQFAPSWAGWFFTLLFYPYDTPAREPEGILPRHITDSRQGLILLRNRYRDADDALLGGYARATQVGGHQHDDAGSIRLMALGHDWILGGGQARGKAEWQSLVTPADGVRPQPYARGAVIWDEADARGGVVGMDLRRASLAYAERYVAVDYSGACGSPVLLALLDQIDDHKGREWHWNLTFAPYLTPRLHGDGAGFDLSAADGACLHARFLGVRPEAIEPQRMPDSERTYQSGGRRRYPGRPYLVARFAHRERLGIYVVLTIQRGPAPEIRGQAGLAVRVGEHHWARPFGAAVPEAFQPGISGALCKYPSGIAGFRTHGEE